MSGRFSALLLCLLSVVATAVPRANAQSVASSSCDSFKNAKDPAQQALYMAYLQGYANASSPDPRYTQSDAALTDTANKVRDWCGKNSKRTFNEAVAAILGSASSSGGAHAMAAAQEPTSCKAGPTQYCGGCSITCNGGKQATCQQGTDNAFGEARCTFQSRCSCKWRQE